MSKAKPHAEVFQLNEPDAEDYLNFTDAQAIDVEDDTKVKRSTRKGSTASAKPARRSVKADLTIVEANLRDDDYTPANDDKSTSRKLPLKSVQEHQLLMNQLNAFTTSARFGPVLKECGIVVSHLRTKSISELRELRERVRACCANAGGSAGIVSAVALGACGRAEAWAPKKFMDLDGFQAEVERNPEFAALCEMIEIDSGFKSSMSPMQRLAMCLGTTALSVAAMNKAKAVASGANAALIASLQAQQAAQRPTEASPAMRAASEAPIREY